MSTSPSASLSTPIGIDPATVGLLGTVERSIAALRHITVDTAAIASGTTLLHTEMQRLVAQAAAAASGKDASDEGWAANLPVCLRAEGGSDVDRADFLGAIIAIDYRHWAASDAVLEAAAHGSAADVRQFYYRVRGGNAPGRVVRGSSAMVEALRDAVDVDGVHWYRPAYMATELTCEFLLDACAFYDSPDAAEARSADPVRRIVMPDMPARAALLQQLGATLQSLPHGGGFYALAVASGRRVFTGTGAGFVERLVALHPRYWDGYVATATPSTTDDDAAVSATAVDWRNVTRDDLTDDGVDCGVVVWALKLAQLTAVALYSARRAFTDDTVADFTDQESLAVCADYQLPRALRHAGILVYDDHLAALVDGLRLLAPGSREEVELRLATTAVSRLLLDDMRGRYGAAHCTVSLLDYCIWLAGRSMPPTTVDGSAPKHHVTVTSMY